MKKTMAVLMSLSMLFGCTNHQDFQTNTSSGQKITTLQQIEWYEVAIPASFSIHFSNRAQYLKSPDFSGSVAGFMFDVSDQILTIEVSGIVRNLEVFAPNLALYDQDFNLLKKYTSDHFKYDRDNFIKGDVLFGDIELNLPFSIKKIYGVIYTTEQDLARTTELLHPAKAVAIAKRNVPPAIDDPYAAHVTSGEVRVVIKKKSMFSGSVVQNKSASAPQIPAYHPESSPVQYIQPETESYYYHAIKSSVAANDLPKALSLLDEAKALGIEGVQEVFVQAVNARH